ncbi:hypothetical protein PI124_g19231 [Phytophthora idaei]|nr:hypothetical protein PI124_g19231 [Phytophthora idaei]
MIAIDENKTVDELKAKMRYSRKNYSCSIDEITLYLAKKDGKWPESPDPDAIRFLRGELPESIKAVMTESNKMDPQRRTGEFEFPPGRYERIGVIVDYPEYIKCRYRDSLVWSDDRDTIITVR